MACYSGPNPVTDDERVVIWRWAKENAIDKGLPFEKVHDAINNYFFGGHAPDGWINDILSGRKTPFKHLADDLWRKQYDRRVIVQKAAELSRMEAMGPVSKVVRVLWTVPRSFETLGHWAVFPFTHAGDMALNPARWDLFFNLIFNTYKGAFSKGEAERILNYMERDALYTTALRSGVDAGPKSHPSGLINRYFDGPSKRAWDMLTVTRFELWKRETKKHIDPSMSEKEVLEFGKAFAGLANHATGSATGGLARGELGGALLFGPKLTQSKLSRLTVDPLDTAKTFANWKNATPAQKAVALTRFSGAVRYAATYLGFLAVNQGLLSALGLHKKEDQINFTDPTKSDYLAFKLGGLEGYVPGLHTEIRTVMHILAVTHMSNKDLRGKPREMELAQIGGQYIMGKFTPAIGRGEELLFGQDYRGRPVPWRPDLATPKKPALSWGEYLGSIGPIPLEGPTGYVYDHLKKGGASAMDATTITKGLIIAGLGWMGLHVQEEHPQKQPSR